MAAPLKLCAALLAGCLMLAACDKAAQSGAAAQDDPNRLVVLAGSELKDIEALLPSIRAATGVELVPKYAGTLDAVERLQGGEAFDLAWLASNRYASLVPAVKARIHASERTMLTPVVLGLKQSRARELGWENNPSLTWKDIASAAVAGKFTFGMTSPATSNSGFSGLLGLAAALSGKGDALEEKDIDAKRLAAFFKAQRMTAGSSGWLAEAYVKDQGKVDGMINYASTMLALNRGATLREPLVLIYPQDGIVTADYPLMLINPARRAAYDKVVAYVRGPQFQKAMSEQTLRRPVNPDVAQAPLPAQALVELSFPAKLAVVDAILAAFDNQVRLPTDSTFVLDQSGSMNDGRIDQLKKAMLGLSGVDTTVSGRFARFRNRERVFLVPFSTAPEATERFDMGKSDSENQVTLALLSKRVGRLQPDGGTAIYDSLIQAYQEALVRRRADPERFYSIVVMTDGVNTQGASSYDFVRWHAALPAAERDLRVFPVVFGEADAAELQHVAELTGGRSFDSRKSSLAAIFKEIRGYQ
jgi:Ca-activated chloride channel family protein